MEARRQDYTSILVPNSRFEDAVAPHNLAIELERIDVQGCSTIEIALRTKIIQEFSLAHGPFWFFEQV